jgi:hypothetical protein
MTPAASQQHATRREVLTRASAAGGAGAAPRIFCRARLRGCDAGVPWLGCCLACLFFTLTPQCIPPPPAGATMKYIIVSGGVISGIGKGVIGAPAVLQ